MARYDAPPGFLMGGIEQQDRSPRIGLSGWVDGRKEAEEVVGNEPILVLLGAAACMFEAELEGLATIDLAEVRQYARDPVDEDHACEPRRQEILLEIVRWFDRCAVDFVIVHGRGICSGADAAAGHAAYGEEKMPQQTVGRHLIFRELSEGFLLTKIVFEPLQDRRGPVR